MKPNVDYELESVCPCYTRPGTFVTVGKTWATNRVSVQGALPIRVSAGWGMGRLMLGSQITVPVRMFSQFTIQPPHLCAVMEQAGPVA